MITQNSMFFTMFMAYSLDLILGFVIAYLLRVIFDEALGSSFGSTLDGQP